MSDQHYSKAIVTSDHLPNVDIITSGKIPPNPHELLIGKKLKSIIYELQKQYDVIVMDSSPVGLVADTYALEDVADLSLFILRQKIFL